MGAQKDIDRTIYHAHPVTKEFIGTGEARIDPLDNTFLLIPAHATQEPPPAAGEHHSAVWSDEGWVLCSDYRGVVYSTLTGAAVMHEALGELPEGFTHIAWPGDDFAWAGNGWELDEAARGVRLAEVERSWRNGELDRVKWLRERHRDEQEIGASPTLTPEQFSDLLAYMQALRQWPQSEQFPDPAQRPGPGASLAVALG